MYKFQSRGFAGPKPSSGRNKKPNLVTTIFIIGIITIIIIGIITIIVIVTVVILPNPQTMVLAEYHQIQTWLLQIYLLFAI